jgi:hypothetical protein
MDWKGAALDGAFVLHATKADSYDFPHLIPKWYAERVLAHAPGVLRVLIGARACDWPCVMDLSISSLVIYRYTNELRPYNHQAMQKIDYRWWLTWVHQRLAVTGLTSCIRLATLPLPSGNFVALCPAPTTPLLTSRNVDAVRSCCLRGSISVPRRELTIVSSTPPLIQHGSLRIVSESLAAPAGISDSDSSAICRYTHCNQSMSMRRRPLHPFPAFSAVPSPSASCLA